MASQVGDLSNALQTELHRHSFSKTAEPSSPKQASNPGSPVAFPLDRDPSAFTGPRRQTGRRQPSVLSAPAESVLNVNGICKATAFCEIYVLGNDDLLSLLDKYPAQRTELLERARAIQKKNYTMNQSLMEQLGGMGASGRLHSNSIGNGRPQHTRLPSMDIHDSGLDSTRHLFTRHFNYAESLNTGNGAPKGELLTIARADVTPQGSSSNLLSLHSASSPKATLTSMKPPGSPPGLSSAGVHQRNPSQMNKSKMVYEMIQSAAAEQQKAQDALNAAQTDMGNAGASKAEMLASSQNKGSGWRGWFKIIVAPASTFRLVWSMLSVAALMYLAISVPISVVLSLDPFETSTITNESWYTDPYFFLVNILVDLFFFVDIYLHWNHFAYMHHGLVIRKLRNIRKHYLYDKSNILHYIQAPYVKIRRILDLSHTNVGGLLKRPLKGRQGGDASKTKKKKMTHAGIFNGFLLDLCMTLPFEIFAAVPVIGVKYGGLLRFNRVLRIAYLFYYFNFIEMWLQNVERDNETASTITDLAADPLAAGVLGPSALVGKKLDMKSIARVVRESFFTFHINHKFLDVFRYLLVLILALWMLAFGWILVAFVPNIRGTSWLERDHLKVSGSVKDTFARSIYLVLLSRTADSEAVSNLEICMSILVMLIGMFLVPGIVGLLEGIVENLDAVSDVFEEKRTVVRSYMNLRNASGELQTRVLSYYDFLWAHHSVDESHLKQHLPPNLHASISVHRFEKLLHKFDFVRGCDSAFLRDFSAGLQLRILPPNLRLYTAGSMALEMFVVASGELRVSDQANAVLATLLPGSVYGQTTLLIDPPPIRDETVVVIDYSQLVVLTREALLSVLDLHPISHEYIAKRLERQTQGLMAKQRTNRGLQVGSDDEEAEAPGEVTSPGDELKERERLAQRHARKRNFGIIQQSHASVIAPRNGDLPNEATLKSLLPSTKRGSMTSTTGALPTGVNPKLMVDEGWLILPTSRWHFVWHALCLIANLWNIFVVPMRIAFLSDPDKFSGVNMTAIYLFDYASDAFFLADIIIRSRFMAVLVSGQSNSKEHASCR
jgi:CRP-like cAMP-binding protein